MSELLLIKRHGSLHPMTEADAEIIAGMTAGEVYRMKWSKPRNAKFHNKYFALLDVLFEMFNPAVEYNGKPVMKNPERFRKDMAIVTGYFDIVANIKGEVRYEAKSISFAKMDDDEFAKLYSRTIDYGLKHIAVGKTQAELDKWVDQIMQFA